MCGIAGIVAPGLPADQVRRTLRRMTDSIIHRGPDDEGFFAAEGVGLGARRLSIIDVAGGHQPIGSEDGHVQVALNGEIYNYLDLRAELESRGHAFRTRSDTEVAAHLYEQSGDEFLTALRGMFGIALWDQVARRLILARDRLGKKPLFYSHQPERLLFGSEIKAILAAAPPLRQHNPDALVPYFRHGFVPEPGTMFRDIRKLPAAHFLVYENGQIKITPYWSLQFADTDDSQHDLRHRVEELDALLEESVRIRLISDVPLGVLLSGGLDSSTIVAYAHKAGLRPIKTFTIGFDRHPWDETSDAQVVANRFETDHHVLTLREADLRKNLPHTLLALVHHCDEPFGDDSFLPTYYLCKLAREQVTVALGGDGGDELFAGYSTYQGIKFAKQYGRLPKWLGTSILPGVVQAAAPCLPIAQRYRALHVAKILRDSSLPFEDAFANKGVVCGNAFLNRLFTGDFATGYLTSETLYYPAPITSILRSSWPAVSKMSYVHLRFHLLEGMLVKVDRMSMAHSLEVRSPLLDQRLVEFAARLPPSLKLRGWQTKAILRDTVRPHLPPETMRKGKHGFSVPLREWLRTSLDEMVGDYLDAEGGRLPRDIFNVSTIKALLMQHRKGECDHSSRIWRLLSYAAWHDLYRA